MLSSLEEIRNPVGVIHALHTLDYVSCLNDTCILIRSPHSTFCSEISVELLSVLLFTLNKCMLKKDGKIHGENIAAKVMSKLYSSFNSVKS